MSYFREGDQYEYQVGEENMCKHEKPVSPRTYVKIRAHETRYKRHHEQKEPEVILCPADRARRLDRHAADQHKQRRDYRAQRKPEGPPIRKRRPGNAERLFPKVYVGVQEGIRR